MSKPKSDPEVCELLLRAGAKADPQRAPDLLLEVPHGATRTEEYRVLARRLRGVLPEGLEDFFHVNTDAGAPELALAIAERFVQLRPGCSALVLRSRIPRTLTDCNRNLDGAPAGMTPGLAPYVRDPLDQALLRDLHQRWVDTARQAFEWVCGAGGYALMTHTYAPRSVDVVVDDQIVQSLRRAYQPEVEPSWPLRPEADFIAMSSEGKPLVDLGLAEDAAEGLRGVGVKAEIGATYPLHPATVSFAWAQRWPRQVLCLELRRDLIADPWQPFAQMRISPQKVARCAQPLAQVFAARSA